MTFLTINAHDGMLDVTCHRNLGTTYLKASEEVVGGGGRGRKQVLQDYC
jgi:hypothetical protein